MILPFDTQDAPYATLVKRVEQCYVMRIECPGFTPMQQCADNNSVVECNFGFQLDVVVALHSFIRVIRQKENKYIGIVFDCLIDVFRP